MSKRGDLCAELRKARQELEQLKDPLIQKARAMGYATEYIEHLEAENKRLKQELADQAISDLGSTVEVIANLEKENKEKDKILRILKRYLHCWKSHIGRLCMGLNERDKYDELGVSKVQYEDWSEWAVELPEDEYKPIEKWLEEKE